MPIEPEDTRVTVPDELQAYLQARPRLLLTVLELLEKYDVATERK